jgi:hypothetical protein
MLMRTISFFEFWFDDRIAIIKPKPSAVFFKNCVRKLQREVCVQADGVRCLHFGHVGVIFVSVVDVYAENVFPSLINLSPYLFATGLRLVC